MTEQPEYAPNESVGYLTGKLKREMARTLNRYIQEAGAPITGEQFRLLMILWVEDGRNQQDLAELFGKDKTSITRMLQLMEKKQLVARVPDKVDKRNNRIYITREGMKVREQLFPQMKRLLLEIESVVPAEDFRIFKEVTRKITDYLSQGNGDAAQTKG